MSTIWQIAKEIETQGREMYEALAESAPKRELAGAFSALAAEEQRHYAIFDSLEKSLPPESGPAEPPIADVPAFFGTVVQTFRDDDEAVAAMRDAEYVYHRALALEKKSVALYVEISSGLTDSFQKGIVGLVIKEEKRHVRIVEGLIEFVRRPKEWLENAEFRHAEEY